jgi:16S rRNA G966 N2-methylase RsmD
MRLGGQGYVFDLVFLDPPYRISSTAEIMARLASAGLLAEDALLVVEHRKGIAPAEHPLFRQKDRRGYGDTEISFFRYIGTS